MSHRKENNNFSEFYFTSQKWTLHFSIIISSGSTRSSVTKAFICSVTLFECESECFKLENKMNVTFLQNKLHTYDSPWQQLESQGNDTVNIQIISLKCAHYHVNEVMNRCEYLRLVHLFLPTAVKRQLRKHRRCRHLVISDEIPTAIDAVVLTSGNTSMTRLPVRIRLKPPENSGGAEFEGNKGNGRARARRAGLSGGSFILQIWNCSCKKHDQAHSQPLLKVQTGSFSPPQLRRVDGWSASQSVSQGEANEIGSLE